MQALKNVWEKLKVYVNPCQQLRFTKTLKFSQSFSVYIWLVNMKTVKAVKNVYFFHQYSLDTYGGFLTWKFMYIIYGKTMV